MSAIISYFNTSMYLCTLDLNIGQFSQSCNGVKDEALTWSSSDFCTAGLETDNMKKWDIKWESADL